MRTDQWLPAVKAPVFMIHGARDDLVGVAHSHQLKTLRPDAELLVLPETVHKDIQNSPAYWDALAASLAKVH